MQNKRFFTVIKVWGMLLIMLSLLMFLSSGIALIYKSNDILPLIYSGIITLIIGIGLRLSSNKYPIEIDKRMGFFIVSTVWIIVSIFGLLPYWLSGHFSFSDAFFETISGFTTTGATCKGNWDSSYSTFCNSLYWERRNVLICCRSSRTCKESIKP